MIVCFKCKRRTKDEIDSLLATGNYANVSEVIELALQNLVMLQSGIEDGHEVFFDEQSDLRRTHRPTAKKAPKVKSSDRNLKKKKHSLHPSLWSDTQTAIPEIFLLSRSEKPSSIAVPPDDVWGDDQDIPLQRWIFGQFNRLLPVKATCRALYNLSFTDKKLCTIREAPQKIATEAVLMGDFLQALDTRSGRNRDTALATAFPQSGEGVEKSRARFASQFVLARNSTGQLSSLPYSLKLLNCGLGRKSLFLTEAGAQFAMLPNPILDKGELGDNRFSKAERNFLIEHILKNVPSEKFAFQQIIGAIMAEENTPAKLDVAMRQHIDKEQSTYSDSALATQRSGAVSRMEDMGLLRRKRMGTSFEYQHTPVAIEFLTG